MIDNDNAAIHEYKIKTFRWLFYISLFQLLVFFTVPILIYPTAYLLYMEILAALTVGVLFGLYFMFVNIYGLFVDKSKKPIYIIMVILMSGWITWSAISWVWIEHMDYLLR